MRITTERETPYNNRFGIMAARCWINQQQFAIHRQFQLDVINLASVETIKHYIFNRLQLSAEGTQNTATTPSRNVACNFMRTFKKIKLTPLTDFESLGLKVASSKGLDITSLPDDQQQEAVGDIMKVNSNTV